MDAKKDILPWRLKGPEKTSVLVELLNNGNSLVSVYLELKLEKGYLYYKNRNKKWAKLDVRLLERHELIEKEPVIE